MEKPNFSQNNVGVSHLVAPYNYSHQAEAKNLIKNSKEFMLSGIHKFQAKYTKKQSLFGGATPAVQAEIKEGGDNQHEESSASIKTLRKKS